MESEDMKKVIHWYNKYQTPLIVLEATFCRRYESICICCQQKSFLLWSHTDLRKLWRDVILRKMAILYSFSLLHFLLW